MSGTRMTAAVAAVEGLSVRYGGTVALDGVSLAAERGSVYALLGRNGAGKSSLVRCLLGEQRPAAGRTRLFGADAWRTRAAAMRRTGVVPETPDMPPAMSARRLAAFCARLYARYDTRGTLDRLERARVPLDTPSGSLSRGQRAQLSLALALGHGPELLVLDDPTLGLDAVARRTVFEELVGDLADRGTTVLLTTHDLAGVEGLADRVGILRAGRLVVDEPLEALKARFRRITAAAANGSAAGPPPLTVVSEGSRGWSREWVVSDFSEGAFAAWSASAPAAVEAEPMTLEDIFVAVTGDGAGGEA